MFLSGMNYNNNKTSAKKLAPTRTKQKLLLPHVFTHKGEIALLLFGVHLVYKLRNASIEVHKEKTILSLAIFVELLISLFLYLVRHSLWNSLSADHLLIMHSIRCQLTVTLTVALVFGPKVSLRTVAAAQCLSRALAT